MTASTRCKISLGAKKKSLFRVSFVEVNEATHRVSVSTVDLKQQNSLVRSENVTYHIFSGEKTHCNQTGGCDWTRGETQTGITTWWEDSERRKPNSLHSTLFMLLL